MNPKERQIVRELVAACEAVVDNWEHGDLAHAAHLCDEAAAFGQEMLEDKETMTVTARINNDGMAGEFVEHPPLVHLEFPRVLLENDGCDQVRESTRWAFRMMAMALAGGSIHSVSFDDECPGCMVRLVEGRCLSGSCVSSRAQEGI
jgi:hypothetical protein